VSTEEQTKTWGAEADAWFNKYESRLIRAESDDFRKIRGLLVKTVWTSTCCGHAISRGARENPTWVRLVMLRILFGDGVLAPSDNSITASKYRESWRNVNWATCCPNGERLIGRIWVSPLINLGGSQTHQVAKFEEPLAERYKTWSRANRHTIIQSIEDEPHVPGAWGLKQPTSPAAQFDKAFPLSLAEMGHNTSHKTCTSGSALSNHNQSKMNLNLKMEADDSSATLSIPSIEANIYDFEMAHSEYARTTRVLALEERVMDLERALHAQGRMGAQILALTKELAQIKKQSAALSTNNRKNPNQNDDIQEWGKWKD
jgi:hypothetical protein